MSRTIRRKNYTPSWVTSRYVLRDLTSCWRRVPLEGKELQKALHRYHSCKHNYWKFPTKFTRQDEQVKHRSTAKVELDKFKKNNEYEVIIPRKNLLPWD